MDGFQDGGYIWAQGVLQYHLIEVPCQSPDTLPGAWVTMPPDSQTPRDMQIMKGPWGPPTRNSIPPGTHRELPRPKEWPIYSKTRLGMNTGRRKLRIWLPQPLMFLMLISWETFVSSLSNLLFSELMPALQCSRIVFMSVSAASGAPMIQMRESATVLRADWRNFCEIWIFLSSANWRKFGAVSSDWSRWEGGPARIWVNMSGGFSLARRSAYAQNLAGPGA